jgi:hypothetical protein
MLWDPSIARNPQNPPGLIFELEPQCDPIPDQRFRNHEVNHTLPFCESPSIGIVMLVVRRGHPGLTTPSRRTLVIPVRAFAAFAPMIGRAKSVPWESWKHFVTTFPYHSGLPILNSRALHVFRADNPRQSAVEVYDFSLRSRRRETQDDPSARPPPYTVRKFAFDADHHNSSFDPMEGGILVTTKVRMHSVVAACQNIDLVSPGARKRGT